MTVLHDGWIELTGGDWVCRHCAPTKEHAQTLLESGDPLPTREDDDSPVARPCEVCGKDR